MTSTLMKHPRKISPRALLVLVLAVLAQTAAAQRTTTTVILVRHAEKAAEPAADPGLTPAGEARARGLVSVARDAGVTAIVTTQFARTRATAQPIAAALHITPDVIDARGAQHAQEVARLIMTKHAGEVVLVVGHSNTIPAIVAALGAPQPSAICDAEYDGLYIVTVPPGGAAHVIRARYGEPTAVAEGCAAMTR